MHSDEILIIFGPTPNQSSQKPKVQGDWPNLPGDGEAFEGPCWETLDTAVELIEASGLQLLLVRRETGAVFHGFLKPGVDGWGCFASRRHNMK